MRLKKKSEYLTHGLMNENSSSNECNCIVCDRELEECK